MRGVAAQLGKLGGTVERSGGERQLPRRRELDQLRALGVDRLEGGDGENHVAIAAGADLPLEVIEIFDNGLRLVGAVGAGDECLPMPTIVPGRPDDLKGMGRPKSDEIRPSGLYDGFPRAATLEEGAADRRAESSFK